MVNSFNYFQFYWSYLPGDDDGAFENKDAAAVTLYKVTDAGGSLNVETISTKPIRQEMLKSEVITVDFKHKKTHTEHDSVIYRSYSVFVGFRTASFWIRAPLFTCGLAVRLLNKKSRNRLSVPKVRFVYAKEIDKPQLRYFTDLNESFRIDFIQTKNYQKWTPIHRIVENAETVSDFAWLLLAF